MNHEVVRISVAVHHHLLFLTCILRIEGRHALIFEFERFLLPTVKLSFKDQLFEQICVRNDIRILKLVVQGRHGFLWEFLLSFLINRIDSLLPVSTFDIETVWRDICFIKMALVKVADRLEGRLFLGM